MNSTVMHAFDRVRGQGMPGQDGPGAQGAQGPQGPQRGGVDADQAQADLATLRQFVTGGGAFAFFDAPGSRATSPRSSSSPPG